MRRVDIIKNQDNNGTTTKMHDAWANALIKAITRWLHICNAVALLL